MREAVAWLGDDASLYEPALTALSQVVPAAAELGSAAALRALAVEYARLFTGPGRPAVMCYASQYLEAVKDRPARLNGAATAYAAAAYQAAGVAPVDSPCELPDHAATELEFLFHLCCREEEAWEGGERDEALCLRRALDGFLREHAARFLTGFAAAVRAASSAELYSALADLLTAHLAVELGTRTPGDGRPSR